MQISPLSRMPATATRSLSTSASPSRRPSSPTSSTASTTPTSTSPQSHDATARIEAQKQGVTTMNALINTALNPLVTALRRSGLLSEDLDYHVVRASMVIMFFFFGYQKWWAYEAERLVPFISNGPLIWWLYPLFGHQGASWFLGVFEWTFGALLLAGFLVKRLGILGGAGPAATFIATRTAMPFISCRRGSAT